MGLVDIKHYVFKELIVFCTWWSLFCFDFDYHYFHK